MLLYLPYLTLPQSYLHNGDIRAAAGLPILPSLSIAGVIANSMNSKKPPSQVCVDPKIA